MIGNQIPWRIREHSAAMKWRFIELPNRRSWLIAVRGRRRALLLQRSPAAFEAFGGVGLAAFGTLAGRGGAAERIEAPRAAAKRLSFDALEYAVHETTTDAVQSYDHRRSTDYNADM